MKHPILSALLAPRGACRIALSLRNDGDRAAFLYRPNACLEGRIDNDVFVIFQGTTRVAYTGRYVKRPAPRPQDFVALAPGAVSLVEVDLAAPTVSSPASYTCAYEAFHDNPAEADSLWEVTSNTVVVGG